MKLSMGLAAKSFGLVAAVGLAFVNPGDAFAGVTKHVVADVATTTTNANLIEGIVGELAKQPRRRPRRAKFARPRKARRGFVWQPGYWRWRGRRQVWQRGKWVRSRRGWVWRAGRYKWNRRLRRYTWKRGRWVKRRVGKRWQRGRWEVRGGRSVWVPGRWIGGGRPMAPRPMYPTAPPPRPQVARPAARAGYVWRAGHWNWRNGRRVWQRGRWVNARRGWRWINGHYKWDGGVRQYVWLPGRWERRRVGKRWVRGKWEMRNGRYQWVAGHWTVAGRAVAPPPTYRGPRSLPPGPRRVKPRAHRRGFIWVTGHYAFTSVGRRWIPGRWVRQRAGWFYVQGRYRWANGRWQWTNGRWMRRRGQRQYVRGQWRRRANGTFFWKAGYWR